MRHRRRYVRTFHKTKFRRIFESPYGIDKQDRYTWRFSSPVLTLRYVERIHRIELQIVLLRLLFVFALPISSPPGLPRDFEARHSVAGLHQISLQIRRA